MTYHLPTLPHDKVHGWQLTGRLENDEKVRGHEEDIQSDT